MVTIELDGKVVSRSKNLRGILDYARKHGVRASDVIKYSNGRGGLYVRFRDGAVAHAMFESHEVAREWIQARRSWR